MGLNSLQGVYMCELHEVCVVPIARVGADFKTVLCRQYELSEGVLFKRGVVPLGFGQGLSPRPAHIAKWLNSYSVSSVADNHVKKLPVFSRDSAQEMVENINSNGNYRVKYKSILPQTIWRSVKVSEADLSQLASIPGHKNVRVNDVSDCLWENLDTGIGVPLALIWLRLFPYEKYRSS